MSQEVSKRLVSRLYPNIPYLQVGCNPSANHLLTSWDIQEQYRLGVEIPALQKPYLFEVLKSGIQNWQRFHGERWRMLTEMFFRKARMEP